MKIYQKNNNRKPTVESKTTNIVSDKDNASNNHQKGKALFMKLKHNNFISTVGTYSFMIPLILAVSLDASAVIDVDNLAKAATNPIKKLIIDYSPVAIFIGAVSGGFLKQGDFKERMIGVGGGALVGGVVMAGVQAGLGMN